MKKRHALFLLAAGIVLSAAKSGLAQDAKCCEDPQRLVAVTEHYEKTVFRPVTRLRWVDIQHQAPVWTPKFKCCEFTGLFGCRQSIPVLTLQRTDHCFSTKQLRPVKECRAVKVRWSETRLVPQASVAPPLEQYRAPALEAIPKAEERAPAPKVQGDHSKNGSRSVPNPLFRPSNLPIASFQR